MQISITAPEIIAKLVEKSKEGDVGAARLLLERFAPATKPTEEQTSLDLGDGTLTEKRARDHAALAAEEGLR